MSERPLLALIYGSERDNRLCDVVGRWTLKQLERHDFEIDLIDPRTAKLDSPSEITVFRSRIAAADGFVVVTPEYNHGYPAALKALIDAAYDEWQAKPVAFVSYGGISGGLRAVEQLRLVFAELHAVGLRDSVSFAYAWNRFDDAGLPTDAASAESAMSKMVTRLRWWTAALHKARLDAPYADAA
jgi:NAD(P)H-dependent FMN reductase